MRQRFAFTLVEMLVAVSVFTVIMVAAVGAYVALLGGSATARAQQEVLDTLQAAVEHIERLTRMADVVACGENLSLAFTPQQHIPCPNGGNSLLLVLDSMTGERVLFRFEGGTLKRSVNGVLAPLVAPSAVIASGSFFTKGQAASIAPMVTVSMEGEVAIGRKGRKSSFSLQTTIAPPMSYDLPSDFGVPQPPAVGEGVVQCVFNNVPGYFVVNAGAGEKYDRDEKLFVLPARRSRQFAGGTWYPWYLAPFRLQGTSTLPAGSYRAVYVQGWDDHCDPTRTGHDTPCPEGANTTFDNPKYNPNDIQPYEEMVVGFYRCKRQTCNPMRDEDIEYVWDSGDTVFSPDIPEPMDYLSREDIPPVSGAINLTRPVDLVVFYHAGRTDNGRICGFIPGKPRTPRNYFCPWWTSAGLPLTRYETAGTYAQAQSLGLAWPTPWPSGVWEKGWNHSVVPACVALLLPAGTPASDVRVIKAEPF